MMFARVNGVVLHYNDKGQHDRPVIVFANSLGTDFRIWDGIVDQLASDYRVICYDKRGHGLSEATPAPYAMTDHVNDLASLLDHLKVGRVAIVGLSVGGMIAQGLAALRPDLVYALVLCDTAHKIGTAELWSRRIDLVGRDGITSIADEIMARWFTAPFRSPDNPDYAGYLAMLTRTNTEGYTGTCAAIRDCDLTESTRALAIPTLCLVGDHDGSTPPELVGSLAELIGNAQFEIIANSGHLPCIEQPAAMVASIDRFLKQADIPD